MHIILFHFFSLLVFSYPEEPSTAHFFEEAKKLQLDQQLEAAQKSYEKLIKLGLHNADVEYNLGRSYVDTKDFPQAAIHLLRAYLLAPDTDTRKSLETLRHTIQIDPTESHKNGLAEAYRSSIWTDMSDYLWHFPLYYWTGALCVLVSILSISYQYSKNMRSLSGRVQNTLLAILLLTSVATLFSLFLSGLKYYYHDYLHPAVILNRVEVKEGPDERFRTLFVLPPGVEVSLFAATESERLVAISLNSGKKAYLLKNMVEKVY